MKTAHIVISLLLVIASLFLCVRIIDNAHQNKQNKIDLAELNDIKYGLLSIEEWKGRITEILTSEIDKLDLSSIGRDEMRQHIEALLSTIIDKVAHNIQKENKGSVSGWVKQSFLNIFVSLEDIKKGIPGYSKAILDEMTSKKSSAQLKAALHEQLEKYSTEIEDSLDQTRRHAIVTGTGSKDVFEAKARLEKEVSSRDFRIERDAWVFIALSVLLFLLTGFGRQGLSPPQYVFLVINLILLLTAGVMTPMIDLEAKISQMTFVVLGHPLQFENQVLYFQSKSILDVFLVMMADDALQMKLVGILMVTFSIVFPALKLISSAAFYANWRRDNAVIKFFVLKSGKWSMADVTVVAIFMAYIGFNGIIDTKLSQLNVATPGPVVLTTNGTSLQPGYYLFFAFALLAMFLTGFLTKNAQPKASVLQQL